MNPIHVILADYDVARREHIAASVEHTQAIVHQCSDRVEAMGKYWVLYAEGIVPRAVVASWLMDTPESRAFFREIGREIDHTSLFLFRNVAMMDRTGMLVCYTDRLSETVTELAAEGLTERVKVLDLETTNPAELMGLVGRQEMEAAEQLTSAGTDVYPALLPKRLSR